MRNIIISITLLFGSLFIFSGCVQQAMSMAKQTAGAAAGKDLTGVAKECLEYVGKKRACDMLPMGKDMCLKALTTDFDKKTVELCNKF